MKRNSFPSALLLTLLFVTHGLSQVPSTLNYQGRVAVNGVNFTGAGQFKFALVNGVGNQTFWSNDGTSSAGGQPTAAVNIPVSSGLYSVLLGDTVLANMTAVPASVFANADVRLRVWFSDGANGFQLMTPDQKIAAVGYAMTAATVPDGSITAAKLAPGVGGGAIADSSVTAAKLASGAAAANLAAGGLSAVASGGIIGSSDPANAALVAQGFVRDPAATTLAETWMTLPTGEAVAAHSTVWTGTELIIWGGVVPVTNPNSPDPSPYTPSNRGLRYNPATGVWTPLSTAGAPQARYGHTAVWTGTEMIIWGGQTGTMTEPGTVLHTGGRYNPATNTWSSMAPNADNSAGPGIIDARQGHLAFWTGSEMLVWGGSSGGIMLGMLPPPPTSLPGRRYNPATNTWSSMAATPSSLGTPPNYAGAWTGSELIIWGGQASGTSDPPVAGRYSPAADAWAALPRIPGDPALPDNGFSLVAAGSDVILWGGFFGPTYFNTGYRFSPGTSSWSATTTTGAPAARARHYALWTGSEMLVWGGRAPGATPTSVQINDGGRYNPSTNAWQSLATTDAPPAQAHGTAILAGTQLVTWGGLQTDEMGMTRKWMKQGGIYDTAGGTWSRLWLGSPAPRFGHTSVWTGTELIVWGGSGNSMVVPGLDPLFGDGARFNPATGVWTPLPAADAPSPRYGHTAVWTGTEMIIWGGARYDAVLGPTPVTLDTGARYNPQTNVWTPMPTVFGPAARSRHTAVWAGAPVNRMIVWGGASDGVSMALNTGARYDPATNAWSSVTTTNAPPAAANHYSLWTGGEMIVHGAAMVTGGRYNPQSNTWQTMAPTPYNFGTPSVAAPLAVWTGTDALVFHNVGSPPAFFIYSPGADYWQQLSITGAPSPLVTTSGPLAVWTGSELILDAQTGAAPNLLAKAARYEPGTGTWTTISGSGAPTLPFGAGVWTGAEMLLWGGAASPDGSPMNTSPSDKGMSYRLPVNFFLYRKP